MASSAVMHTYKRLPVAFVKGEGAWLTCSEGKEYLDALAGIAVCGLGHAHPRITQVISEQAAKLTHTSNLYEIPLQEQAAQKLCQLAGMQEAFFCNSGAEANEGAIKLARLYGNNKGINQPQIVVMENSFHGRTLATLTATGNRQVQAGFEPLVSGFIRVSYNDLASLEAIFANRQDIAAVLLEPIQGEGGLTPATQEFMQGVAKLCADNDALFMLDEVQTGNCRTGHFYAYQGFDVQPDVLTTAKGLGNGFPVGAVMAAGKAKGLFQPGNHGTTYGGTPLAAAIVLEVLTILEEEKLAARAAELGEQILKGLQYNLAYLEGIVALRGQGLMMGIELEKPCTELVELALKEGLLINVTAQKVVRLLPPLILTNQEAERLVEKLSQLLKTWLSQQAEQEATTDNDN